MVNQTPQNEQVINDTLPFGTPSLKFGHVIFKGRLHPVLEQLFQDKTRNWDKKYTPITFKFI